ncbi:MAG: hypothetical protein GTO40_07375, partial [Deltaproteobacteria bacterium]|nr:hypothetical protein [Deltaproteobacteria bacterium]
DPMCTLAFYFQRFSKYPIVVAANRDERLERPSGPPQWLIEEEGVFGGKDLLAGGTWLGVNHSGMLVGIVNRRSESIPAGVEFKSR